MEALLLYTLQANVRPTSTAALRRGGGSPLSAARWPPPNDGGGAEVWPRYGWWSRFLSSHGVVRWVDLYGGVEWLPVQQCFGGYWMSFDQLMGYYNVAPRTLTLSQRRRAEAEHSTLMHEIEADGEARAWLWAYSTLRANDVHEASRQTCSPDDPLAHTVAECGPPSEQTEVQAELERLDEAAER